MELLKLLLLLLLLIAASSAPSVIGEQRRELAVGASAAASSASPTPTWPAGAPPPTSPAPATATATVAFVRISTPTPTKGTAPSTAAPSTASPVSKRASPSTPTTGGFVSTAATASPRPSATAPAGSARSSASTSMPTGFSASSPTPTNGRARSTAASSPSAPSTPAGSSQPPATASADLSPTSASPSTRTGLLRGSSSPSPSTSTPSKGTSLRSPLVVRTSGPACEALKLARGVVNECARKLTVPSEDCCASLFVITSKGRQCLCAVRNEAYFAFSSVANIGQLASIYGNCNGDDELAFVLDIGNSCSSPPPPPPPPAADPAPPPRSHRRSWLGWLLAVFVFSAAGGFTICIVRRRKQREAFLRRPIVGPGGVIGLTSILIDEGEREWDGLMAPHNLALAVPPPAASHLPNDLYSTFTWEEILNATASFSLKIGTGSNGTVYKGHLNHLDVAIKVLHSDDKSSTKHFNQELEVLSKIRHPHLLMLLGACPDRVCLVYEYMENGSLADRLQRRKGTPPIPWFDRFRIAWEIGSALVFLHSTKPSPIIHRDLKPENVLLDRNLLSKIGDVGLSTLMPPKETLSNRTVYKKTGLAGTMFYLDPEYHRTGQVSVKSDTYALGMVILQLLTARCPIGLPEMVKLAVEDGQISHVLDESAGDWPVREAHDLAQLGLNCLEMRSKDRPELNSVVLEELGRLKCIAASVSGVALPGSPSHFKCPILKTVMYDPCIAADGYTYERSAMETWLCDKDVSPVTKARLRDKTLLPNLSLKSAIMRWVAEGGRPVKE